MPPKGPSLLTFPNPFFCPKQGGHSLPGQSTPPQPRVRSKLPRTCGPRPSADDLAEGIIPHALTPRNIQTHVDIHRHTLRAQTQRHVHTQQHTQPRPPAPPSASWEKEGGPSSSLPCRGWSGIPRGPAPLSPPSNVQAHQGGYGPSPKLMRTVPAVPGALRGLGLKLPL